MSFRVAVLPGDGIGPEVVAQGVEVLRKAAAMAEMGLELQWGVVGGCAIDASGDPLPDASLHLCGRAMPFCSAPSEALNGITSRQRFAPSVACCGCARN